VTPLLLSSAEVARLLGVTAGSVKRWADAGLIRCARTAGRHRRFERDEVDRFLRSRDGGAQSGPELVDRLLSEGDVHALQADLLAERARLGAWWRVAEALGTVLEEMGRRWADGNLTVLEEHVAAERFARTVARCAESLPPRPGAPRVLLATAEGEDHTLGLSLVELVVREWGWTALWAGRRTPLSEVTALVAGGGLDAVAVSAGPGCTAGDLSAQVERLAEICRAGEVHLAVGGTGPWPEDIPHGRRVRGFAGLREWMADVERDGGWGQGSTP
jgi:excisionase family DNA binding protein